MYSVCPSLILGVTSRDGQTGISDESYIRVPGGVTLLG